MAKKLSYTKSSKIIALYLKGHNQTAIARMLHVDQSTVSKYIGKFKALAEQKGIHAALLEFGVQDNPEETQAVVEEFHKSALTIADVNIALQIAKLLQQCGVKPEEHKDFIQAATKAKKGGYVESAIHLNKLENKTGMSYEEIVSNADKKLAQLNKAGQEMENTNQLIKKSQLQLAEAQKEEKQAFDGLKQHMEQIGVDEARSKKVEALALLLKQAGVTDASLADYIARQQSLAKSGLSVSLFDEIVAKAKVATKGDGGKALLGMLAEFGSLAATINQQQGKKNQLIKEVSDLEQKAQLKAQLESEIKKLLGDKNALEPAVSKLEETRQQYEQDMSQLGADLQVRTDTKKQLDLRISDLLSQQNHLQEEIEKKQEGVADLDQRKAERDKAVAELDEMQTRMKKEGRRWQVFEGFLGMVQANSEEKLKKALQDLPVLLETVEKGKYSPDLLKNWIFRKLGVVLQLAECSCGASFSVDRPAPSGGYRCPINSPGEQHQISVTKETASMLDKALAEPKTGPAISPASVVSGPKEKEKT